MYSTKFVENMNKEPKRQSFVDVSPRGVNHDISMFYLIVCSVHDCIFFNEFL
jgi:hypothetical protein